MTLNDKILLGLLTLDFEALDIQELLGYEPQEPSEVRYFHREHMHNHQYISLMYYNGKFLEAALEIFWVKRSNKPRRHTLKLRDSQMNGTAGIYYNIYRGEESDKEILTAVEKEYQLDTL